MTARPVLIVTPSLDRGGAERHSSWIATALDRGRWSAHVLSFADGPGRQELTAAGIPVHINPVAGGYRGIRDTAGVVRRLVDEIDPALISGHHIRTEVPIRLALRGRPRPYIAWKHTYGHIGIRGQRERLFERATGDAVTRYGAVCHTQVRYLTDELGLPGQKISVVCNAVPVPAELPGPSAGVPIVLMVAAMRADKDHALVLRAWPGVLAGRPDARLRLAGDGPCRADLESLAATLGIRHSVDFLGVRSDVELLLAQAQLLVLGSYAVECFPYAVLEAMAAGRGVVSTNVAGLPELVDDGITGRLVPPHDVAALGAALAQGLADISVGDFRWGTAGWERVRRVFPLDRWAEQVADLFDDVAGQRDSVRVALSGRSR